MRSARLLSVGTEIDFSVLAFESQSNSLERDYMGYTIYSLGQSNLRNTDI